jgi:hypothetical protein
MKPTFSERLIAYLALLSGLSISAVAVYYSVIGLTAIFAAAAVPIIIMGVALEVSKLVATAWVKQNWNIAPRLIKGYLIAAIVVLMMITSMGIFGFLSKAHMDQNLVSGDVLAKISVYDEKIKVAKENIDVNRKALKQLDEAVDQVMARSQDEKGADKAVAIRRAQSKERSRLLYDIEAEQKTIARLNEERAPIAAEVRKVEAEVGPIKYIAAFVYGNTDQAILEKAVTWVILSLIVVFDPLAVILLLAAQTSFQNFRKPLETEDHTTPWPSEWTEQDFDELAKETLSDVSPIKEDIVTEEEKAELLKAFAEPEVHHPDTHPYLKQGFGEQRHPPGVEPVGPLVSEPDPVIEIKPPVPVIKREESNIRRTKVFPRRETTLAEYIQNEEQQESNLWTAATSSTNAITPEQYVVQSQQRRDDTEDHVIYLAANVRAGRMHMNEVPAELVDRVKAKL